MDRDTSEDLHPPQSISADVEKLMINLHDIGAVKFGSFKLKSGIQSPFYVDLRTIVSFPKTLALVARLMAQVTADLRYDVLCGVPYTALPIATAMALNGLRPMVMRRREKKEHGLGKMIEGCFSRGDECLVVEDLVSSGTSIMETVRDLEQAGITARMAVVVLDRQQGGIANLAREGVSCRAVMDISSMVRLLCDKGRLDQSTCDAVLDFVRTTHAPLKLSDAAHTQPAALELPMAAAGGNAGDDACGMCGVDSADLKEDGTGGLRVSSKDSRMHVARDGAVHVHPKSEAEREEAIHMPQTLATAPVPALPPMVSEAGLANVQRVLRMSYEERAALASNGVAQMLLTVMALKKSNLCLSADVTTTAELLELARACGPHIAMLKTHADIIEDYSSDTAQQLRACALQYGFVLLEDRKVADIGHTCMLQVRGGVHRIATWAHCITAHALPGPGVLDGIALGYQQAHSERTAMHVSAGAPAGHDCERASQAVRAKADEPGVFLLAQMSSADNLIDDHYTRRTVEMARASPLACGFIAQERLVGKCGNPASTGDGCGAACGGMCGAGMVIATPGVQLASAVRGGLEGDGLRQQYNTPRNVILRGTDVIIVGRGILRADDPTEMAERYREEGWRAYLERTGQ